MIRKIFLVGGIAVIVSFIIFIACSLPSNPLDDPKNLQIDIATKNGISIIQGQRMPVEITFNVPKFVKNIEIKFGESDKDWDTSFAYSNPSTSPVIITISGVFLDSGERKIIVNATTIDNLIKTNSINVQVVPKPLTIQFDTIPKDSFLLVNTPDTLKYSVKTEGVVVFTATSIPQLDTSGLKLSYAGTNAAIVLTCKQAGTIKVKLLAQSGNVKDSCVKNLKVYNKPSFSFAAQSSSLQTGQVDTLTFVAKHDSLDSIKVHLLNPDSVISVIKAVPETLSAIFKPVVPGTYQYNIAVNGKVYGDTIHITETVTKEESVWKQQAVEINGTEGSIVQQSLLSYINKLPSGVTFTSEKGSIADTTWKWMIPWGSSSVDTVTLTANNNNVSSDFKIILHILPGDSGKPSIKESYPTTQDFITSSSQITCKFIVSDSLSGINSVRFSVNDQPLTDTSHTDSTTYQCVVSNLKQGQKTALKIKATDKSIKHNADSLLVYLTYDPTITDNVSPVILQQSGPKTNERMKTSDGTITVSIKDSSGISDVSCSLNGVKLTNVTNTGNLYTIPFTLTKFGTNRIVINAKDSSAAHNQDSLVIMPIYDTQISDNLALSLPAANGTEIDTLPQFSWTGADDPDNDTVFYKVYYGLSQTSMTASGELTTKSLKLTSKLLTNTKYYWKVVAYSHQFSDSVFSAIQSFTTINKAPELSLTLPANGGTKVDPLNGILRYSGVDPEGGTVIYSVALSDSKENVLASTMRTDNITSTSVKLSDFGALAKATKYYWRVIGTDDGIVPKSDTSEIDSFFTINTAPVWSEILSKDTSYYRCAIDLSKFCKDPDIGQNLTFKLVTDSGVSLTGTLLTVKADSQLVTVRAIDNFAAQPCSTDISFRRWFRNPLMKFIPAAGASVTVVNNAPPHTTINGYTDTIPNSFWMDSTEITKGDFLSLVNKINVLDLSASYPMVNITWYDAILYCNERSKRDGLDTVYSYTTHNSTPCTNIENLVIRDSVFGYRLPKEAEWQYACAGGVSTQYYWGNDASVMSNYVWYTDNSDSTVHYVAKKLPNAYGLYDMLGNVAEWCIEAETSHFVPQAKQVRGGSINSMQNEIYPIARSFAPANLYYETFGFRVILSKN